MERFLGLTDFGILPVIGFGVIVFLLVTAFKGKGGKDGKGSNSSSSTTSTTNNNDTTGTE